MKVVMMMRASKSLPLEMGEGPPPSLPSSCPFKSFFAPICIFGEMNRWYGHVEGGSNRSIQTTPGELYISESMMFGDNQAMLDHIGKVSFCWPVWSGVVLQ